MKTSNSFVLVSRWIQGFSLVELMIGLFLSSILMSVTIQAYIIAMDAFRFHEAFTETLIKGQYVLDTFTDVIRNAGCVGSLPMSLLEASQEGKPFATSSPLTVFKAPFSTEKVHLTSEWIKRLEKHSNILHVFQIQDFSQKLIRPMMQRSVFEVEFSPKWVEKSRWILSDLRHVDVFDVERVQKFSSFQRVMTKKPLSVLYRTPVMIGGMGAPLYFVADTLRKNHHKEPIYALYRQRATMDVEEWMDGVLSVYFEPFGSQEVVVHVLIESEEDVFYRPVSYQWLGKSMQPSKRFHRELQTKVYMRNGEHHVV